MPPMLKSLHINPGFGLVPAIHVFLGFSEDGKAGHHEVG
jgi:hypothetical protein